MVLINYKICTYVQVGSIATGLILVLLFGIFSFVRYQGNFVYILELQKYVFISSGLLPVKLSQQAENHQK